MGLKEIPEILRKRPTPVIWSPKFPDKKIIGINTGRLLGLPSPALTPEEQKLSEVADAFLEFHAATLGLHKYFPNEPGRKEIKSVAEDVANGTYPTARFRFYREGVKKALEIWFRDPEIRERALACEKRADGKWCTWGLDSHKKQNEFGYFYPEERCPIEFNRFYELMSKAERLEMSRHWDELLDKAPCKLR